MADSGDGGDATLEDLREKSLKEIASETVGSGLSITRHPNTRRSYPLDVDINNFIQKYWNKGIVDFKADSIEAAKTKIRTIFRTERSRVGIDIVNCMS